MTGHGDDPEPALAAWGGDAAVLERLGGGSRNRVWAVRVGGLVILTWLDGEPPGDERAWRLDGRAHPRPPPPGRAPPPPPGNPWILIRASGQPREPVPGVR